MSRNLIALVLMALACLASVYGQAPFWPLPAEYELGTSTLSLKSNFQFTTTGVTGEAASILKENFNRYNSLINRSIPTNAQGSLTSCSVTLKTSDVPSITLSDEAYSLKINTDNSCSIEASNVWGALRGLETFSQLLQVEKDGVVMPYAPVTVTDQARYGHRGMLLDSARHFIPMSEIKRVIDTLQMNKFNVLHWHMIDAESFPVELPSEPSLLNPFSPEKFFTMEDLQEINMYARSRGVEVLYELDVPGHAASWAKGKPEIMADCMQKYTNINNYALNPSLPETYTTIKNILSDIFTATNATKIHLGGDEVVYGCWNNDQSIVEFQKENGFNGDQTLGYFVNNADKIANDLGAQVIHWEEVFSAGVEVPPGTIFQVWTDSSMMSALTSAGHTVIASPSDYWYVNLVATNWNSMYTYDPTNGLSEKESELIIGGEGTLWAEYIDQYNIEATMYPRASAIAERLWSPKSVNDVTEATTRMITQKCRLVNRGFQSAPVKPADYCQTTPL